MLPRHFSHLPVRCRTPSAPCMLWHLQQCWEVSLHAQRLQRVSPRSLSRARSRPFCIPLPPSGGTANKKTKTKKPTQPNPLPSSQGQIPCCHGYHSNFSCGTRNKKTSLRTEGYIMLALPPSPHSSLLATKSATSGIFNLG